VGVVQQGAHHVRIGQQGFPPRENSFGMTGQNRPAIQPHGGLPLNQISQTAEQVSVEVLAVEEETILQPAVSQHSGVGYGQHSRQVDGYDGCHKKAGFFFHHNHGRSAAGSQQNLGLFIGQIAEGFIQNQRTVTAEDHGLSSLQWSHGSTPGKLPNQHVVDIIAA